MPKRAKICHPLKLELIRSLPGLDQSEKAKFLGISQGAFSQWCRSSIRGAVERFLLKSWNVLSAEQRKNAIKKLLPITDNGSENDKLSRRTIEDDRMPKIEPAQKNMPVFYVSTMSEFDQVRETVKNGLDGFVVIGSIDSAQSNTPIPKPVKSLKRKFAKLKLKPVKTNTTLTPNLTPKLSPKLVETAKKSGLGRLSKKRKLKFRGVHFEFTDKGRGKLRKTTGYQDKSSFDWMEESEKKGPILGLLTRKLDLIKDEIPLVLVTKKGIVKRVNLSGISDRIDRESLVIKLNDDDSLVSSDWYFEESDLLIATKNGKCLRFSGESLQPLGSYAKGCRGIKLLPGDEVASITTIRPSENGSILTLTEKGYVKRMCPKAYKSQNRGGQGVMNPKAGPRNGRMVAVLFVPDSISIIWQTKNGILGTFKATTAPKIKEKYQGKKCIDVPKGDLIVRAHWIRR